LDTRIRIKLYRTTNYCWRQ